MNNTTAHKKRQTQSAGTSANATSNTDTGQRTDFQELAIIAARLFLIATLIVNTTKEDSLLIIAAKLSLLANSILARAAVLEAREQQVAPGRTTLANNLKLVGTKGALFSSFLIFSALIIEVGLKEQISIGGQPLGAGTAGAFFF